MTKTPLVDRNHPLAVKIRKQMTQAMAEFNMVSDGDKLMLCVSGGKDSSIMTILFEEIRKRSERKFTFEAVILDQKQPGFNPEEYKAWLAAEGIPLTILEKDTYSVVTEKVKDGVYCSLCSKMRRAILYDYAFDQKFTKMALGHHRDDVMETTLLNLFYVGQLSTMPPKLKSDDDRNTVIRPMVFVAEKDLIELAEVWKFPVIPCNLCGSQEGMKRKKMKKLIQELEKDIPHIGASFSNALQNAKPSHLMDHKLYNFKDI